MTTGKTLLSGLVSATAIAGLAAAGALATHGSPPPPNDNYLQSRQINRPGAPLRRNAEIKDIQDTTDATVQRDLFNPRKDGSAGGGGPVELTQCGAGSAAVRIGRTVWYDFYPDVDGRVSIEAIGLDAVLALYRFDARTGRPDYRGVPCSNRSDGVKEELFQTVRRGQPYTIQLGGARESAGFVELRFEFFPDSDGDGELDADDRCPKLAGTMDGCPVRLQAESSLRARGGGGDGIEVVTLRTRAPAGARVELRCSRACPRQVLQAPERDAPRGGHTLSFRRMAHRDLPPGTRIEVRVTRPRAIGVYFRYTIGRDGFTRLERCLQPGSTRPRLRCGAARSRRRDGASPSGDRLAILARPHGPRLHQAIPDDRRPYAGAARGFAGDGAAGALPPRARLHRGVRALP